MTPGFDLKGFDLNKLAIADGLADPGASEDAPVDLLRRRLAVRGWARPLLLIDESDAARRDKFLSALAPEVETAVETRPGQWYLAVPVRRRVLARCGREELRSAVAPLPGEDPGDPLRQAFSLWVEDRYPPLDTLPSDVLPELDNVRGWTGSQWSAPYGAQQIRAEIAARTLDADLRRMTAYPLVGQHHRDACDLLETFATRPARGGASGIYLHGGGGTGKTTLLAFLQNRLRRRKPPIAIARIDFDEPAIDPARMSTLNLALYEQLARCVPGIAERGDFILDNLRQLSQMQRNADFAERGGPGSGLKRSTAVAAESVFAQTASDEGSILYHTLAADVLRGPLVLVLDTAELILSHSDRAISGLVFWLRFLRSEAQAEDIRLIVAGRDAPPGTSEAEQGPATRGLLERLAEEGVEFDPPIALTELDPQESSQLLRNSGIADKAVADAAAAAVPGNPLLLRITADALLSDDSDIRQTVREAHQESRIDPDSARNYLMRRIVAHVADPEARPYVLAALYSPFATRDLLREVIMPAVERGGGAGAADGTQARRRADRLFRALASTHWIASPNLDSRTVRFNRDIRAFALKLMAANPDSGILERDLRQSAAIHHLQRRSGFDRALAIYHLAMLGQPYRRPAIKARAEMAQVLRDVLDELPEALRNWLTAEPEPTGASAATAPDDAPPAMSDAEWRLYLEGEPDRDGEGMKLVKDDRATEALALYASRPTRPHGLAPPFVVRALADLGDWHNELIDIEAIIATQQERWLGARRLTPDDLSELYWVTRFALQRDNAVLPQPYVGLLRHITAITSGPGLTAFPALIAVAEARLKVAIMDPRMRRAALASGNEPRVLLGAADDAGFEQVELAAGQIAVVQANWWDRLQRIPEIARALDLSRLHWLQQDLLSLQGRPMAEVNRLFDRLRERVPVKVGRLDERQRALLLRGMTPEFHRPMREALLTVCADGIVGPATRALLDPVLGAMTILPAEMKPAAFYERLSGNPRAWASALVSFADQCRLLPLLAGTIATRAADERARRIAKSFQSWDAALCRSGSSDWSLPD
ncbi:hypothetical protein [Novosphingobium album (ex Liu et al. 2023)]|uniref:ATP-binding protein n=1 Tax=Novosphingobium album (ex Liu et al. 2023) TaxID=3031130 RepID=A0ABT5WTA0_9SPHN|nr:hypothetical protein [Novosphingobium album (ex Liu et al. 2023)]MDE8652513.1 hypothetical protein [Novosphingobium album (ex Liu et al. 2023)]